MDTHSSTQHTTPNRLVRVGAAAAIAIVLGVGSYGVASAASGSSTGTTTQSTAPAAPPGAGAPSAQAPWGAQRSDETPLTGDALAKVTAIAQSKLPGATIVRVETDADGVATYEAHVVSSDGTPATVYVDKDFAFVSVQTR